MLTLALDISLRIIAAAAAVGLVLVVFRVRSGAARHAAWSAVLLAMLTMPVLTTFGPRVEVPVPSTLVLDFGAIAGGPDPYETLVPPVKHDRIEHETSPGAQSPAAETRQSPARLPVDWRTAAIALYAAGVWFFVLRLAAGWVMARRLVAGATRVASDNRAPVFESAAVATPMTTGIVSPCVLLPTTWCEWPEDKLNAVLAHENAHIARRDSLVALLAHANRAIFWFHPLAWWLERTLAVTAEHACDETAAREVGQPRRYAEMLLDMAEGVRRQGHRVSWQAIGVHGSGLLGARIDHLLRGDVMARMSTARRAGLAIGCAAVLVVAIACRQQIAAEPLRPDPEVQKQIDENKARSERHKAAVAMTAAEAAALEKTLETNPDNLEARETLIVFYDQAGKVSWEEKLAGIRKHALWRLANLPETDLWIPHISKRYDPEGYERAKQLWLEQTSRPDVTPKTLGRAAAFLDWSDKPMAEELLLRAQRMDPTGPWSNRLGDLYAAAIVGSVDPRYRTTDAGEAASPFAAEARRKLEASSDPNLLASAGYGLTMLYSRPAAAVGADALGRRCLERAASLDPRNARAQSALADLRRYERTREIQGRLFPAGAAGTVDRFSDITYAAVSALPEEDRLFYLPGAAEVAYTGAEYLDYTAGGKPKAEQAEARKRAAEGFARARQYANDALALARKHPQAAQDNAVIYRAETVLGVLALKDGDRKRAVAHMRTAADAPVSDPGNSLQFSLRGRLVEYLLREGERESVAEYLEKSAERSPPERDRLMKDAGQIRAGMMPPSYQYAEARR